ncbi:hypothetical protein [Devosia faecipullorum]|uniref:hypothetical protein n=1 Tax=Devosia faecipullorum TaxID=2755039 RepID=UPI00187B29C5|nr:hypothetical protein [Devosia faecipullorum]MBE7732150.1 hypothetical protein [Devosia faecipullorum]
MQTYVPPPSLCGLIFTDAGNGVWKAPPTEEFWPLYRANKNGLFRIGLKVEAVDHDQWRVVYTARFAPANVQQCVDLLLQRFRDTAAERDEAQRRRAEFEAEIAARRAAKKAEQEAMLAAELPKAIAAARQCLATYGEFTVNKKRVREIISNSENPDAPWPLGEASLADLRAAVADTDSKSDSMLRHVASVDKAAVDWPEDEVVDAVLKLTGRDGDMALFDNDIGWNRPDSSPGHWCAAMIGSGDPAKRAAGIKLGRVLVGKYSVTQLGREAA